jgi:hypothetical protein
MASPNEKLAEALQALSPLLAAGRRVFRSDELSRVHRSRLIANGFLQEVIKGWLLSSNPGARAGDSTPWYASFWEFCASYCDRRFGDQWHLSPEQSLLLLAENSVVPAQVVVYSPKATNHNLELPFGTSLYDLKQPEMPIASEMIVQDRLKLYSQSAALAKVPVSFFRRQPIEVQVALTNMRDASDLLRVLLTGGNSTKAGVIAGALRRIGRTTIADEIVTTMSSAGYDVRESDPFSPEQTFGTLAGATPPIVARLQAMWQSMRPVVQENFPPPPGLPKDARSYLESVEDIYKSDAYNSLSIEGYSVTPELIDRVRRGDWDPEHDEQDRQSHDALAARGYWQAFRKVKEAISDILSGAKPVERARTAHMDWYREMFQPYVLAGVSPAASLAGYRNNAVYLRTSRYVPPRWEAVRDAMPTLFELLENETHAGVRAVLGHWLFGYIHPYPDGNGRMARFLMNVMLASGGYPWTVIKVEQRDAYLSALDKASIELDILPFTMFVAEQMRQSAPRRKTK